MALIERDPAFFDDTGDNSWFRGARTDRANASMSIGDLVNLRAHPCGGQKGIAPAIHWGTPGMRRLASKNNGVSLDAESSQDRSQGQIQIEKDRTLFNMQLQISGRVL